MEGCLDIGAIQDGQRNGVGMLVVRAEKIEQEKAQDSIVQKFNKDRDSLRVIMSETDSDLASRENL
jgi:hypothetical protein